MMVKSLVELCLAVCTRNIKDINDMGDIPFSLVRPIIMKIDNPVQLRKIEISSPHFEEETEELWRRFITRDFPVLSERHKFAPKNPRSWHKIYAKYQRLDIDGKRAAEEKLKNAYKEIKKEKDQTLSQVVTYDSRKLPRLPRDVKPQVGQRPKGPRFGTDQSELRFTGGSRTKTNTPKSLLKRAMREAKEISSKNRLNTLAATRVPSRQIVRAPAGMVQEKINNARPLTGIRPPPTRLESSPRNREIEHREEALRKAKEAHLSKGGSYIEDEDLDDLDIEDEDGPVGLEVDYLEAPVNRREPSPKRKRLDSSAAPARGSPFARKMKGSSAVPSISRVHTEAQPKKKPDEPQPTEKSTTMSSTRSVGPASPPLKPAPSSSSVSPGSAPMASRKRKPVGVFMKPKPKVQRRD